MAWTKIHNKSQFWRADEAVANAGISPGMLGEITSAGKVKAHATEGGRAERIIVLEDMEQGRSYETAYSTGERVFLAHGLPGDVWNMLLANGENVTPDKELVSAGDGTLIDKDTASSPSKIKQVIGHPEVAYDNSSGGAAVLIAVRLS